jgi:hypothetical protein
MASPKLTPMGIKRKELHSAEMAASPKSEKDYDNEEVRPELHVSGEHARMLGAAGLKKGDRVRQVVEWEVKDHVKRDENGKPTDYSMTLCMDKASDCEACGEEEESEEGDEKPSAGLAYITGRAAKD